MKEARVFHLEPEAECFWVAQRFSAAIKAKIIGGFSR
jgi:hypothetical protein